MKENNYSSAHLSVILLSEVQRKLNCKISAKYHGNWGSRCYVKKYKLVFTGGVRGSLPYMLDVAEKAHLSLI